MAAAEAERLEIEASGKAKATTLAARADADAARARLADTGFDVSEVRTGRKAGTRVFTVRGEPCGVPTLFIGPDPS